MNKDEIKKALECCCGYEASCDNCPNAKNKEYGCKDKLLANVHNLITEQEKEIEQLKAENKVWSTQVYQAYDNGYKDGYDSIEEDIIQAKIDVLNKMKDYINQLACDEYGDSACDTNYITIDIDKYEQDIDEIIEELKK